ncbi:DUF1361 domain-containing protein [Paenibacillus chartarius]|uniref:DUF1361 domain-containing protein n=1 Tax=Paenibacillus chartarius TaxID=747481 RepID=A0ABV6DSJ7_9BACL
MREISYRIPFLLAAALTAIVVVAQLGVSELLHKTYYNFLIWNLFLAWLPFVFAIAADQLNRRAAKPHPVILTLLGIAWLLFFPNAPYIVTDMLHLTIRKTSYVQGNQVSLSYWNDLVLITMYAWIALLVGAVSTYLMHTMIRRWASALTGWAFIAVTSVLSGYGILLGRVYRLNSWDVLSDSGLLLKTIEDTMNVKAAWFSLIFGGLIAAVYLTFYVLINLKGRETESR